MRRHDDQSVLRRTRHRGHGRPRRRRGAARQRQPASGPTSSGSTTATSAKPARSTSARSPSTSSRAGATSAGGITLTGERSIDDARLAALLAQLREQRRLVADDPFLLYNETPTSTERIERGAIPEPAAALADIRRGGEGHDLVGIYASGDTFNGFANSLGQRNWFQTATFNLDWCFYLEADKAAKNLYAGFDWSDELFAAQDRLVDAPARRARSRHR